MYKRGKEKHKGPKKTQDTDIHKKSGHTVKNTTQEGKETMQEFSFFYQSGDGLAL